MMHPLNMIKDGQPKFLQKIADSNQQNAWKDRVKKNKEELEKQRSESIAKKVADKDARINSAIRRKKDEDNKKRN